MEFIHEVINPVAWVVANMVLAYIAFALVVFVVMYYALFDPQATTGGKLIFRFMISLVGLIGLLFLGIFVDPAPDREWFSYPGDYVEWWRPVLRLFIYGYVAFTITSLAVLLVKRKWFPSRIEAIAPQPLVKVRHETSEIPIVTSSPETPDDPSQ